MRYSILALLPLLAMFSMAQSYNGSFLNLYSPISGVSQGDFEFSMNHRFFGAALKNEPLDSFFGLDNGANVRFGVQYYLRDEFFLGLSHTRLGNNNTIRGGWSTTPATNLLFGIEAGYKTVKLSGSDDREGGLIATGAISLEFLQGKLRPVINYAFDGYAENDGPGFGIEFQATDKLALLGEYYPVSDEDAPEDCMAFTARYNTWGHQFLLGLTNSSGIGIYEQLPGSATQDLSFALSIRRLF